jgi:bifunctional UDP-N-acetylglucosamine pyrophosphorylase/glucosamine-1-phosphate N-acetyltransferase
VQQAELERVWQLQQAHRFLEAGVSLGDPTRFDLRGSLHVGRDVFIDVGCLFENNVTLADGVRIGPYCVLRDVEVGPGAVIAAFSYLEQTVIDAYASIGPYACIRAERR